MSVGDGSMGDVTDEKAARWQILPPGGSSAPTPSAEQLRAAAPAAGVTVVVGGPGTGKTETLLAAVDARLTAGTSLSRLAVVVGSRREAQRIRRQVLRRTGSAQVAPRITTVHGLSLGWVREFAVGDVPWRLLAAPEQELRIRDLLDELGTQFWPPAYREAVQTRGFARQVRDVIARARQLSMDPADVARVAEAGGDVLFARLADFFEAYLTVSDFDGSLDYAELVYRTRLLLREPEVASAIMAGTDAIIADDIQALDPAQAGLLVDCAVLGIPVHAFGDPQQRIHAFRGATQDAFAALGAVPGARLFELRQGHRNVAAVGAAVAGISGRLSVTGAPPTPTAAPGVEGKVTARVFDDSASQWAHVAADLRNAVVVDGLAWGELAVIMRAGRSQLRPLARELARHGIPVEPAGDDGPLSGHHAVRVLLAGLGVAASPTGPAPDAVPDLLTSPLGRLDGLGLRRLGRALLKAHPGKGGSIELIARSVGEPDLLEACDASEARTVGLLAALLGAARASLASGAPVEEALWTLWDGTDWPAQLKREALSGSLHASGELDAVVALFEVAARRPHLAGASGARTFIAEVLGQEIAADTERELRPGVRGVNLMTAHASASGEWRRVWVVGVQEGSWPRMAAGGLLLDPDRLFTAGLLEAGPRSALGPERQLFHVACSRAREQLHVTSSDDETGSPSRFLDELGVTVQRVHGRPSERLGMSALVGELRRSATDSAMSQGMRRAAALRLARLDRAVDHEGAPWYRPAAPEGWWGGHATTGSTPDRVDPVVIQASRLQELLDCPRRWFLAGRARAEPPRASGASFGDVVHLLAQHAVTDGLGVPQLEEVLERAWEDMEFESAWLAQSELEEARAAITRFVRWQEATPALVLGVEVPFHVEVLVGSRTVALSGTVDRLELLDGRLRVVDLKTGRRLMRPADVRDHAQLGVYQLAAGLGAFDAHAPGVRSVAPPGLLLLRHGQAMPVLVTQATLNEAPTLPDEPLAVGPTWVHDALARAVAIIDSEEFPARRCGGCKWCPFFGSCPAWHRTGIEVGA